MNEDVASGDVSHNSATIWARVDKKSTMNLLYDDNSAFLHPVSKINGWTVDNTVQKTGESVEQAPSAVVETVDDTGNILGNTVQKIDDGVTKILINDDDNDGDSNDSDSNDDEKDDDGDSNDDDGGSLKDTVKKLLS